MGCGLWKMRCMCKSRDGYTLINIYISLSQLSPEAFHRPSMHHNTTDQSSGILQLDGTTGAAPHPLSAWLSAWSSIVTHHHHHHLLLSQMVLESCLTYPFRIPTHPPIRCHLSSFCGCFSCPYLPRNLSLGASCIRSPDPVHIDHLTRHHRTHCTLLDSNLHPPQL